MTALMHAPEGQVYDLKTFNTEAKILDGSQGIVEAIVSVTNVVDDVGDVIEPGAYKDTLGPNGKMPKGCFSHLWEQPVAKTLYIEELMPGDVRLPAKIQAIGGGGLLVKMQFNMNTQRGREAFSDVEFYKDTSEWSIGYSVPEGGSTIDRKTGIRYIQKVDLYEYSSVLFGANAHTATLSIKGAISKHSSDTSDSTWDGGENEHRLNNDDGASVYRKAYAWVDPDKDPDTKVAYRFIHHFVSDNGSVGAASTVACQQGIGVLNGARGGTTIPSGDKQGVWSHLAGHLRSAGLEPPELKSDSEGENKAWPHEFMPSEEYPAVCTECGLPETAPTHVGSEHHSADHGSEKQGPCFEHFAIKIGDATGQAHCEREIGHKGSHGFNDNQEDPAMGTKNTPVVEVKADEESKTPDGEQEVTVEKAPNETENATTEKLSEDLTAKLEEDSDKGQEAAAEAGLDEGKPEKSAENVTETKEASATPDITAAISALTEVATALTKVVGSLVQKKDWEDTDDDGRELVHKYIPATGDAHCAFCGQPEDAVIHTAYVEASAETPELESKVNVSMAGSFEDVQGRLYGSLAASLPAPSTQGAEQEFWIEATFADHVLVCVCEYTIGEEDDWGYPEVNFLGSAYYSYPYVSNNGVVNVGDPTAVDVTAVMVPKTAYAEALFEKIGEAIGKKTRLSPTATAGIWAKIAEVLSAIQTEKTAEEAETKSDEDETTDEKVAPEGELLTVAELMQAKVLSLTVD